MQLKTSRCQWTLLQRGCTSATRGAALSTPSMSPWSTGPGSRRLVKQTFPCWCSKWKYGNVQHVFFCQQFPCCVLLVTLKSLHSNFAQTLQPLPISLTFVKPKALGLNLICWQDYIYNIFTSTFFLKRPSAPAWFYLTKPDCHFACMCWQGINC